LAEATTMTRRGLMLVLSSPSGAGKTTLARRLLALEPQLKLSISVTTRKPRPGEVEGRDYFFRDEAEFDRMRDAGEFLEWARVHSNFYGTPRSAVMAALARGEDVLFDIDWQGARQLRESASADLVRVFVLPPSVPELLKRLTVRATDSADVIEARMAEAVNEISHWAEYDYVVVNADLDRSVAQLHTILTAEQLRRDRQMGLNAFARALQDGLQAIDGASALAAPAASPRAKRPAGKPKPA
jgi:guanylate kinase